MDTASQLAVPETAADRAYHYVKDAIVRRTVSADRLLAEGQIADAVGVSRTPVREALLRLEAEGLVRLLPKRGVLVVPVTAEEVQDVIETRRLIEQHAVDKVIGGDGRSALVAAMKAHVDTMADCIATADAESYVRADRAFHTELVRAAGNAILTGVYGSMRDRQLRMGVVNLLGDAAASTEGTGVDTARMATTLAEHRTILDALAAGNRAAAKRAMTTHLALTSRLLGRR